MPSKPINTATVLDYLEKNPGLDIKTLAGVFEVKYEVIRRNYIKPLHAAGRIHISGWRVEPGHQIARYSVGSQPDMIRVLSDERNLSKRVRKPKKVVVKKPKAPVIQIKYQPVIDPLTAYALGIAA